jgi:hypothetical protein
LKVLRSLAVAATLCAVVLVLPTMASAHQYRSAAFAHALVNPAEFATMTGAVYDTTTNMHPMGFTARRGPTFNSDLAFWGDRAYQGTYSGFRIIDISQPDNPLVVNNYEDCAVGQGDVVIWDDILIRSWDTNNTSPTRTCDGDPVPVGFEGVHIFDISNPADPDLLSSVDLACGSHTASGFPDVDNGRFILYSTPSSGSCDGIDVIEIPLATPEAPVYHGLSLAGTDVANANGFACHDTGIILGDALKAACAGGQGLAVWSLGGEEGGSFTDPQFLYNKVVGHGVSIGHSAAFSWDGETLVFGHEPGGGSAARCQTTGAPLNPSGTSVQTDDMKSFFFFDVASGEEIGKWTLPRSQTATENCTLHNLNVVPTKRGDVLVHGSYQSGIGVLDFTDPADAKEIAYADPEPLSPTALQLGGDWSTYWYDGRIYESDITRGLMVWNLSDRATAGSAKLGHLNPQTQEYTID